MQIHCGAQQGNCMGGGLRSDATRVEHVRPLANASRRFFGAGLLSKPGLGSETNAVFGWLRNGCFAAARSSEVFVTWLSGDGNGKITSSWSRSTPQFTIQRQDRRTIQLPSPPDQKGIPTRARHSTSIGSSWHASQRRTGRWRSVVMISLRWPSSLAASNCASLGITACASRGTATALYSAPSTVRIRDVSISNGKMAARLASISTKAWKLEGR